MRSTCEAFVKSRPFVPPGERATEPIVSPVTVTVLNVAGAARTPGIGSTATCEVERTTATARSPLSARSRSVTGPGSVIVVRVPVSSATAVIAASPSRRMSATLPFGVTETSREPGSSFGVSEMGTFFSTSGAAPSCTIATPSWVTAYARA